VGLRSPLSARCVPARRWRSSAPSSNARSDGCCFPRIERTALLNSVSADPAGLSSGLVLTETRVGRAEMVRALPTDTVPPYRRRDETASISAGTTGDIGREHVVMKLRLI